MNKSFISVEVRVNLSQIRSYSSLASSPAPADMKEMLDSLVVVKLNGSLATPLGCSGPTSTIPLRDNLTSLDLTVQQLQHLNRK